jgi:hypothetical protein
MTLEGRSGSEGQKSLVRDKGRTIAAQVRTLVATDCTIRRWSGEFVFQIDIKRDRHGLQKDPGLSNQ